MKWEKSFAAQLRKNHAREQRKKLVRWSHLAEPAKRMPGPQAMYYPGEVPPEGWAVQHTASDLNMIWGAAAPAVTTDGGIVRCITGAGAGAASCDGNVDRR